jgi:hypothetical protein
MTCSTDQLSPHDARSEDPKGDVGQVIRAHALTLLRTIYTNWTCSALWT